MSVSAASDAEISICTGTPSMPSLRLHAPWTSPMHTRPNLDTLQHHVPDVLHAPVLHERADNALPRDGFEHKDQQHRNHGHTAVEDLC